MGHTNLNRSNRTMIALYAVYSKRGIYTEITKGPRGGTKQVVLTGKELAEKKAAELSQAHKRRHWVEEVEVAPKR